MRTLRPLLLALVAAPLVATLTGCVVIPAHRYHGYDRGYVDGGGGGYGAGYSEGGPVVTGTIWIDGYWDNRGGGRRWIPGHYGPRR